MKKVFLLVASALLAVGLAQAINNPKYTVGTNTFYVVQWDCENDYWAASNEFEVDQTFTFAVDISDKADLVAWVADAPAGVTRSIAANIWAGADMQGIDIRLHNIQDNIYGATINLKQIALGRGKTLVKDDDGNKADDIGQFTAFSATFFGYARDASGASGVSWYVLPYANISDVFSTLEYTGTNISPAFTYGNNPKMNDDENLSGSEVPCKFEGGLGIGDVIANGKTIVGYYSILGVKLNDAPASGIFIEKYSDGTSAKIVK